MAPQARVPGRPQAGRPDHAGTTAGKANPAGGGCGPPIVDRAATAAGDLVGRDFNPAAPDTTWCGDITYLRTGEGWLFLATVIDLFSRRVIGWSAAAHMRTELVADALEMAVATRGGTVSGVVFHTDRGSQYTSAGFGALCEQLGVTQSMGATGVCWDNAAGGELLRDAQT